MTCVAVLTTFAREQLSAAWAIRDFNDVNVVKQGDGFVVEIADSRERSYHAVRAGATRIG